MAREQLSRSRHVSATPDRVWAHIQDFCAPWHPLIATMEAQDGGQTRAFTVQGEATLYRERLTWYSATERAMRYSLLEGIEGAQRYAGHISVTAAEQGGSIVTMSAELEAPVPRAKEIAGGTATIFDIGLSALGDLPEQPVPALAALPQPVPSQPLIFDTNPQLALEVTPERNGPLCLFLHGIGGNRDNWQGQLGLAGTLTRAAALDLRGYGQSTLGAAQSSVNDYCDDILRVAKKLSADRLILCGLSYGAWIATAFAEKFPDKVAGLILSGGCTGMSEAKAQERDAFRASREVPLDAGQTPADFAPAVINVIAGPHATAQARRAMETSMAAIPVKTYRDALRCFTNPPGKFDFSRLSMPVLMMTGEHDTLAPPAEINAVAKRIHGASPQPDVRFEMIKGAGHICNLEAPDLYNAPLMEFIRRVAR